ncbi:hypothetical protein [Nocardia lasii]|uniref:DUF222 domain-containing protein n=1 Tax=Nocardia lasii TaxID=1616107 RepID=A0ABW1JWF5_9NOCA
MSSDSQSDRHGHHPDGFAEFAEELRLLAEVLLARVEPVLRRTAADGQADLGGCSWCPVCAAAALVRGNHHDVVAALAEHGTSMVTVLREALAGIPVEPVLPQEWADHAAGHPNSTDPHAEQPRTEPFATADARPHATGPNEARSAERHTTSTESRKRSQRGAFPRDESDQRAAAPPAPTEEPRTGTPHARAAEPTPRPRRVGEYPAPRPTHPPHITPEPDASEAANASGTGTFAPEPPKSDRRAAPNRASTRSGYVDIPVTIRG